MPPVERILVIDTATPACSVAAADADGPQIGLILLRKETHARHVMTMAEHVLAQLDWRFDALTHLAVSCGPGSFTGLRIGISSIKGMALALNLPVFALPSLELLAFQAKGWQGPVVPMIDARRQEVYYAVYRWEKEQLTVLKPPAVGSPETAVDAINEPVLLLGDGAMAYRKVLQQRLGGSTGFPAGIWNTPHALTAALALVANEWPLIPVSPAAVVPIYLRKSDAEVNLLQKQAETA